MTNSSENPSRNTLTNSPVAGNSAQTKQNYEYNYRYIQPLAMVDVLPDGEQFSIAWYRLLAKQVREIFLNTLVVNRGNRGSESLRDDVRDFIFEALREEALPVQLDILGRVLQIAPQLLIKGISRDFREIDDLVLSLVKDFGLYVFRDLLARVSARLERSSPTGHVTNLEDYKKLFPVLDLPLFASTFTEDEIFAYMQVAGFNPLMIQQVSTLSDRFPLSNAQYQEIMGSDDSLEEAGREGRLYIADYKILENALNGTYKKYQKYLYAPIALFAVAKGTDKSRMLQPVAIQCGQTPGDTNPIITPKSDKYAWSFAKTVVLIADANFHEPVSHLGRTHLFVGPFVIATHRRLSKNHPLSVLLRPHFEGTLAINDAAQRVLIAPKGGVDQMLSSTIDNSRVLAVIGVQSYGFNSAMLSKQLKKRGVDDPEKLPVYPYRDDALLVWEAIHQWVSSYLKIYYSTDNDVQKDTELQAWATEVQAPNGGRVPEFGEEYGRIQTLDYLIDAATLIIFTASAQHAAVNFPQKGYMSYPPGTPLAGYQPASKLQGEVTEQDYLNLLPPLDQAQRQINLTTILGSVYYNRLGIYPEEHFPAKVKPLLQTFQENLKQIEDTINQRNLNRPTYEYLLPSKIPQSINI